MSQDKQVFLQHYNFVLSFSCISTLEILITLLRGCYRTYRMFIMISLALLLILFDLIYTKTTYYKTKINGWLCRHKVIHKNTPWVKKAGEADSINSVEFLYGAFREINSCILVYCIVLFRLICFAQLYWRIFNDPTTPPGAYDIWNFHYSSAHFYEITDFFSVTCLKVPNTE